MTEGLKGRFLWYELMTLDTAAAKTFYGKVAGWTITAFEGLGAPYEMWSNAGQPIGGLMALPEEARKMGAPSHWLMYVGTDDVDATHKLASDLGARTYVAPRDIPTVGRFAVLADPQGAVFAIYQPANPPQTPETAPGLGMIAWHELYTADIAAAWSFYSTLFGWQLQQDMDMGPMGIYRVFGRGPIQWGGMMTAPPNMPMPPHWLLYTRVADITATLETIKASGGKILNGPMDVPGGLRIAQCMDPQGAAFAIVS